jgi:hypothetical protein
MNEENVRKRKKDGDNLMVSDIKSKMNLVYMTRVIFFRISMPGKDKQKPIYYCKESVV